MKKLLCFLLIVCILAPALVACDKKSKKSTPPSHRLVDGVCADCGEVVYVRDGNYIYFGEFPQTVKAEGVEITSTVDGRGYYLGSDGCYYAKTTVNFSSNRPSFSNGEQIREGKEFYFKVEPIRWQILSQDGETAFLLCDSILYCMSFDSTPSYFYDTEGKYCHAYSSNYQECDPRIWLNTDFYFSAFTEPAQSIILTTEVDNSPESAGYKDHEYTCENTLDKIFLLSYAEAINPDYGFLEYDRVYSRDGVVYCLEGLSRNDSDYALATSNALAGCWWLRSPYGFGENEYGYANEDALCVGGDRTGLSSKRHTLDVLGLVPALRITLGD